MTATAYSASNRSIHLWGLGSMADYFLYVAFNALILPIYSIAFGLDPRYIAWALTLPRLVDAVADPLIGRLSDNFQSRWGRRRPFMVFSAVLGSAALVLIWWADPAWSTWAKFAWLVGCSVVLFFSYGMYTMAHQAMGYELTDDHHMRPKVWAIRSMYFSIASGLCGGWLYWLTLRPMFHGEINGVRWVAVGMAAVLLTSMLITVKNCRERFQRPKRSHVDMFHALRQTLTLRPFAIYLLHRIVGALGGLGSATMGFYLGLYYVCQGDKDLQSTFSGYNGWIGFGLSFLMVPLAVKLSQRIDRRQAYILGAGVAVLGSLCALLTTLPGRPYLNWAVGLGFMVVGQVVGVVTAAIMPDICDIDELRSGERREGLFTAVLAFQAKVETSICTLASSYLVVWAGFDAAAAKQGLLPSPEVMQRMWWMVLLPPIIVGIIAFIIACFFPITREMMEDVRAKLAERRAAAPPEEAEPAAVPARAPAPAPAPA